jgi:iron complex outermembrane recepter protein
MYTASAGSQRRSIPRAVRAALLLASAATANASWAQNVSAAGESDNGPPTVLQEVVVTAERRSVSLQQTAISATVLTTDDLQKKGINSVDALQFTTPARGLLAYWL